MQHRFNERTRGLSVVGVYRIDIIGSDHFYIGSSFNVRNRWKAHTGALRRGDHDNTFMQRAAEKYGLEAVAITLLEIVESRDDVRAREQHYLDTLCPDLNLAPLAGTCVGVRLSAEARAKISAANSRRWAAIDSVERKRIGAAMLEGRAGLPHGRLGKINSAETRAKMSAAKKGRPSPTLGKPMSAASRAKLAAAHRGKALSLEHRVAIGNGLRGQKRAPYNYVKRSNVNAETIGAVA